MKIKIRDYKSWINAFDCEVPSEPEPVRIDKTSVIARFPSAPEPDDLIGQTFECDHLVPYIFIPSTT
jgi:hypothetical protein